MQKSVHTPEYKALCADLRRIREHAGLSQRELALRLKVSHSWVAKVEMGERRIDLVECGWLLAACGENPSDALVRLLRHIHMAGKGRSNKGANAK